MSFEDSDVLAYGVKEAVRILGISRTMLYAEMKKGRLRYFKVGARTFISREDARAWVDLMSWQSRDERS